MQTPSSTQFAISVQKASATQSAQKHGSVALHVPSGAGHVSQVGIPTLQSETHVVHSAIEHFPSGAPLSQIWHTGSVAGQSTMHLPPHSAIVHVPFAKAPSQPG